MNVAVIGTGYWGKKHVEEYNQLGHHVTICDNDEKNVSSCKEKFSFVDVKTLEQILDDSQIKYVSICTPNETHFNIPAPGVLCSNGLVVTYTLDNIDQMNVLYNG